MTHSASNKQSKDKDLKREEASCVYAKINKEVATMLKGDDLIVFGPAEDFEYTVPLEDFKKSRQNKAR